MHMAGKIRLMPELLSSKIAAGEVVERPASVVKELVENSIDAGATEITVEVGDGGRRLVRVTDNGEGMSREDAALAFERHATSKISTEEDLLNIRTMGFRGEALSSIAAVARVTLKTRPRDETTGTRVQVDGGSRPMVMDEGCPVGTTVEVRDLFYNTPARQKFLRSPRTEFSRILDSVKRIALIHPGIRFTLLHGPSRVIDAKKGRLKERVLDIFGPDVLKGLVEIGGRVADKSGICVSGLVSRPELSYTTSRHLFTYVNGRWVRDRSLNRAVHNGFSGMLDPSRYPFSIIDLRLPFDEVDVNVHPAKCEVRFKNHSLIYNMVMSSVRDALAGSGQAPAVRSSSGVYVPVEEALPPLAKVHAAEEPRPEPLYRTRSAPAGATERTERLDFQGTEDKINPEFMDAEIVGQLWGEFLIVQKDEEFFVIDQHGAAERVRFERLRERFYRDGEVGSQYLLLPERFETTPEERDALKEVMPYLERMGFDIEPFGPSRIHGGETFIIKASPEILSGRRSAELVKELVEELAETGSRSKVERGIDSALMRIACHSVIRGRRTLSKEEAMALLRDLAGVDFSGHCPHGRPVVRRFSRAEVEAMFERR